MKKVYKKLTEDQLKRGVIFSSTLSKYRTEQTEDTKHEVFNTETSTETELKIRRLLNDKYFNSSHWNYNIVRRGF